MSFQTKKFSRYYELNLTDREVEIILEGLLALDINYEKGISSVKSTTDLIEYFIKAARENANSRKYSDNKEIMETEL